VTSRPATVPDVERRILVTLSGDIYTKSNRTRRRLLELLWGNLQAGLARGAPGAQLLRGPQGRWSILAADQADLESALVVASRTFGVYRLELARAIPAASMDQLVHAAAELAAPRVRGRTFAVRARVRGATAIGRAAAEVALGEELRGISAGVDLGRPEVTVDVHVWGEEAFYIERRDAGPDGLPLGSQPRVLAMLSGGFDSAVAAWYLMRRGCPLDFVHFEMECAQAEHALAVAYELWQRWGAGTEPRAWLVDFSQVKGALEDHVPPAYRQLLLKQQMFRAAAALARFHRYPALVTGEAVGQVSSQTVDSLAAVDRAHAITVFRPLTGFSKEEIIERSRLVGTHDLSARAREVCNLTAGRVETRPRAGRLATAGAGMPPEVLERAVSGRRAVAIPGWCPGKEVGRSGGERGPASSHLDGPDGSITISA
jgi:thiamine biosynthesis protein ThiI